tara:strand:+ start:135 stop:740 length:606 start_codon:yes stop_codon:yes gene_type:complete
MDLSYDKIKKLYKKKKYKFCEGTYNLNIFGIRDTCFADDTFNDYIGVAYEDECEFKVDLYKGSTDPAVHYLRNPLNRNGTIIMLEGQYRGCYKIGIHNRSKPVNSYSALEQIGPMSYIRDNNKDDVLDIDESKKITGVYKTNVHRCSKYRVLRYVGLYSAGCQVIQNPKHFDAFMDTANRQVSLGWGDKFSYTLFNIKDFS